MRWVVAYFSVIGSRKLNMIISEKQIMQLICIANQLLIVIGNNEESSDNLKDNFKYINGLLGQIANQQSEKLIEINDDT